VSVFSITSLPVDFYLEADILLKNSGFSRVGGAYNENCWSLKDG